MRAMITIGLLLSATTLFGVGCKKSNENAANASTTTNAETSAAESTNKPVANAATEKPQPTDPSATASTQQQTEISPEKKRELMREAARQRAARLPAEPINEDADFIKRPFDKSLRIVSFNVNWDRIFPDKDERVAKKFRRVFPVLDGDIIGFQEIGEHSAEETVALLNDVMPLADGQSWHAFRGSRMVIASRFPFLVTDAAFDTPTYRDPAMVVVDLPDDRFPADIAVLNNHFKCCKGYDNDPIRQKQADANMHWVRDVMTDGGAVDMKPGSGVVILGDLNLVGGRGPLETLVTGDITDEDTYGADFQPDWDSTALAIADLKHNKIGPDYTWRDDNQKWPPGRLDYVIYSDSVLVETNAFALNTTTCSDEVLATLGLEKYDICLDDEGIRFDHYPLVVDFEMRPLASGDSQ